MHRQQLIKHIRDGSLAILRHCTHQVTKYVKDLLRKVRGHQSTGIHDKNPSQIASRFDKRHVSLVGTSDESRILELSLDFTNLKLVTRIL